ncbi:hypothetical protein EDEG_02310 [Edhazardia aedis USNM 41457]|uniref:Uncharacterized protein n=1 Tax=Edhazardia aedis (strain USNM 41457) TaxID=1003232 RepID=J8ZUJ8_EDHAE|nr:hypothetical protein EDEG_02310 [Edhazardia aedis USNM 41457]|eukprot:EJW03353.1 hypothetical protein EDEG_02310 [Edhazardia aedis USNM 41457]
MKTKKKIDISDSSISSEELESESFSSDSSEVEYEIKTIDNSFEDQIKMFLKYSKKYDNIDKSAKDIMKKSIGSFSGDYLFAFAGFELFESHKKLLNKTLRKKCEKFCKQSDLKILIFEKFINLQYSAILKLLEKLIVPESNFLYISRCNLISKEEVKEMNEIFPEYSAEDLKLRPVFEEELFLLSDSLEKSSTSIEDAHFRIFLLNDECLKKYIAKISKEI